MPKHIKLFTPGPGDVDEEVLEMLSQPVMRHFGPQYMEIYNEVLSTLRLIFKTRNEMFLIPGPASALMDMAIGSLVGSGESIIACSNGFFGDRIFDIAQGYGIRSIPFRAPLGKPLDPEALSELLKQHPEADVVAMVHHETGTTVLNPLRELAAVVKAAGKVLVVDTVSSMGGVEMDVDGWGIDVCVTAANKCLESVPGIAFVSVSEQAWELANRQPLEGHGWYLNLRTWRKYATEWGSWHPSPVTTPVHNVLAVRTSMRKIMARGLPAHFNRYARASQVVRSGLRGLGFEMYVPDAYAAPIVTGVKARPEFDIADLSKWLLEERSMAIGGAFGELSGKIFRIGHLGKAAEQAYLDDLLFAMHDYLDTKGIRNAAPVLAGKN